MTEKFEPRWRRWGDEKPHLEVAVIQLAADEDVPDIVSVNLHPWRDQDLWMPCHEWKQILEGIPGNLDPNEWIVAELNEVAGPSVGWCVRRRRHTAHLSLHTTKDSALVVAEAMNTTEGR